MVALIFRQCRRLSSPKKCCDCGEMKPRTSEYFKFRSDGRMATGRCRKCQAIKDFVAKQAWAKLNYVANREKIRARSKARYEANRDMLIKQNSEYRRRDGRVAANAWSRKWRAQQRKDPIVRLNAAMSERMRFSLRSGKRSQRWIDLVGYPLEELKVHLEAQFVKGMSWENYGSRWHVDHIQPIASFQIEVPGDAEFMACWAKANLRPLWEEANRKKHARREFLL